MRLKTALLITAVVLSVPCAAWAQSAQVDDIVVTAEKRATNLQDTPVPVAAIRGEDLARQNVVQLEQLDKVVPDVSIFAGAGTLTVISVRGVSAGDWNPTAESPNVVFVDGALIPHFGALEGHFYDLERVEVLKGPQGTLYGRGAASGTINIISHRPDLGKLGGRAELEYGSFNLRRVEGAFNAPISEDWAARIAFRSIKRDGYYEDTGFADADTQSVRASLLGNLNERATLYVTGDFEQTHGLGTAFVPDQVVGGYGAFTVTNPEEPWRNATRWAAAVPFYKVDLRTWGTQATFDYRFDGVTATVQYGHREYDEINNSPLGINVLIPNGPGSFGPGGVQINGSVVTLPGLFGPNGYAIAAINSLAGAHSDTIEARLTSTNDGPLKWIAGVYGYSDSVAQLATGGFVNYWIRPLETTSYAAFGQGTYSFTDQLDLTLGARYTHDKKSQIADNSPPFVVVGVPAVEAEWDKVTWKANVSYKLTDSNLVYAQASTGFKPGQISSNATVANRAIASPETLTAYEIGSKNDFFDKSLRVNLEAYYYDYDVLQAFANANRCRVLVLGTTNTCVNVGGGPTIEQDIDTFQQSTTISPGGSKQYGVSASVQWLPTPVDQLIANVSYMHNEYGDYNRNAATLAVYPDAQFLVPGGDQSNQRFGPEPWRANVSYTHTFEIASGAIDLTGDVYYYGQAIDSIMRLKEPQQYTLSGRDAYLLGDLSVRYAPSDSNWFVRAYVNNVADSDHLATKTYTDLANGAQFAAAKSGYITGAYVQPRTWGIAFGANF